MTYRELFELKFKKGYSTSQLLHRYPQEVGKVTEIALLELSTAELRRMLPEEERLERILLMKRRFLGAAG